VVRRAGAAARPVVENRVARGHLLGQLKHDPKVAGDLLRQMVLVRDREMLGENRERVAEDHVFAAEIQATLIAREIGFAEEALALADAFRIDFCSR
jgi:hypothetical protein